MLRFLSTFCLLILFSSPAVLKAQQKSDDPVLLTVGNENIRLSEFEAVYKKNNQVTDRKALEDYLELYIKFRLKVHDALDLGMDTLKKFKTELAGYRKQLAEPYLSDNEVTVELVKEAYERMKYEIEASHIIVNVKPDATPADTLRAFKKIEEIRKRLVKGEDFAKVATEVSDDPSVRENQGNLGYFSALYMVYSFETAAYNLKPGEISQPVRSPFGYHLIKLHDKQPNRGEIRVAHIMKKLPKNPNEGEIETARMKIGEIYDKLKNGESFEELASQFSDDEGSAKRGGALPPFTAGKMVREFEDAAFTLEEDGEFTKPIRTAYGFHVLKRISLKPLGTFEEMAPELKQRIARDQRSRLSRASFIKKMKAEYGFTENPERRKDFYKVIDSTYFQHNWALEKAAGLKKLMFKLGDTSIDQSDFAQHLFDVQPRVSKTSITNLIDRSYEYYVGEVCTQYEDARLESKYPEFRMLMKEYHDGILLFDLTDEKVWSKAVKDTSGLLAFYEKHKNEHTWGRRLDAVIYDNADVNTSASVRKWVKARKKKNYTDEDILKMANESSQLNLDIERGKFSKGDNVIIDKIDWKKGLSDDVVLNNRVYFVEVREVLPEQIKVLDEVRGLMTSAYQNYLEEKWIEELRGKYNVKVNREYLSQIN